MNLTVKNNESFDVLDKIIIIGEKTFYDNRKETIKERDKRKYDLCKGKVNLFYYSNIKVENYFDKVYNDKEELLNAIKLKYEEKLL